MHVRGRSRSGRAQSSRSGAKNDWTEFPHERRLRIEAPQRDPEEDRLKPVRGGVFLVLFCATAVHAQSACQAARDNLQSLEAMNTTGHLDGLIAQQRINVNMICSGEQVYRPFAPRVPSSSSPSYDDDDEDNDEPSICDRYGDSSPQCCADREDSVRTFSRPHPTGAVSERLRLMLLEYAREHIRKHCSAPSSPPSTSASRAPEGYVPSEYREYDTNVEERACKANASSAECCKQKQLSLGYWPKVKGDRRFVDEDRQHLERYCQSRVQLRQNQGGVNIPPVREVRRAQEQVRMANECLRTYDFTRVQGHTGTGVRYHFQNTCSHPIYFSICTVQDVRNNNKYSCENVQYLRPGQSDYTGAGNVPKITENKVHQSKMACAASTSCYDTISKWVRRQRSTTY